MRALMMLLAMAAAAGPAVVRRYGGEFTEDQIAFTDLIHGCG